MMPIVEIRSRAQRRTSPDAFYGSDASIHDPGGTIMACITCYHTIVIDAPSALIASMRRLVA